MRIVDLNFMGVMLKVQEDGKLWVIRNNEWVPIGRGKRTFPYFNAYFKEINKSCAVHRLVAMAFIPNPNNKPCVNHINGNRTDNRPSNLEWVTDKENVVHSWRIRQLGRRSYKKGYVKAYVNGTPYYLESWDVINKANNPIIT